MSTWLSRSHSDPKILNKYDRPDITVDLHKILRSRPHLKWYKDKNKRWYIVHTQHSISNAQSATKEIILPINGKHMFVNENELTTVRKIKTNINNETNMNYRILNELMNTIDILYRSLYKNTKQKSMPKHINMNNHNHNHTRDGLNNISNISNAHTIEFNKKTSQIKKKYKLKIAEYEKEISSLKASFHNEQMQLREQNIILRKDYDNLSKMYNDLKMKYIKNNSNNKTDSKKYNKQIVNRKDEKHQIKAVETTSNKIDNLQLISETFQIGNIKEEYMFHCNLIQKNIKYYKTKKIKDKKKRKAKKLNKNNIINDRNNTNNIDTNRMLNVEIVENQID